MWPDSLATLFAPAGVIAIAENQHDQESSWLLHVHSSMHQNDQTLGSGGAKQNEEERQTIKSDFLSIFW